MRNPLTNNFPLICIVTLQVLAINTGIAAPLTYQEGGAPSNATDPALDVNPSSRRYVCSVGGSDSNNGLTQASAWASIGKIKSSWGSIPDNAIITLCRGGSWNASNLSSIGGAPNSPTAIGAYGVCIPSPHFDNHCSNAPRITGELVFNGSSWITVRDLSVRELDTSHGSHDMLVYRLQAKGSSDADNIMRGFGNSYHMVYVENVAGDASGNDIYSAHTGQGNANEDGWWFIDNICVGSGGGEDCIDLMNAESGQGTTHNTKDTKVIAMRSIGVPVSGWSELSGSIARCMNSGHDGEYYWFIGNICMGWPTSSTGNWSLGSSGNYNSTDKRFAHISGNVFIATNTNATRISIPGLSIKHNTMIANSGLALDINDNQRDDEYNHITYNIMAQTSGGSGTLMDSDRSITTMDNNWFGLNSSKSVVSGQTLSQRQSQTSFDQNSGEGSIPGFTVPTLGAYPNPNTWFKAAFLDDITPSSSWSACDGTNTPGARTCEGEWIWELEPITGAPNGGCGWAGLPIVAVKLAELGVTGECAPEWSGTPPAPDSSTPEPPTWIL